MVVRFLDLFITFFAAPYPELTLTYRQELLLSCKYPPFFIRLLAFRTMAVAARVVADTQVSATIASIHMAAQCCRAAFFQSIQHT